MAYDLATVTNSGNQLLASVVPDKSSLVIDKIEVSGTQLASSTDLKSMTSISNVVQTLSANGYQKKDNSFIISTVLDNSSVKVDYKAWVFGIWAHKSDGGSSVLMSVITSTDSPDTISKGSGTPIDYNYKFVTTFSNTKSLKIKMSSDTYATNDTVLHNSGDETATGTKTFQKIKISNDKFPTLVQTDGQYITLDGGNTEIVPADNSKVVHTTGDETIDGKKKFDTDPTDGAGNAYAKTVYVNQQLDKKVNVSDMRKPASDVAGIEEVSTLQTQVDNSAVGTNLALGTSSNWQKLAPQAGWGVQVLCDPTYEIVNGETYTIQVETRNATSQIMLEPYCFTAKGTRLSMLAPQKIADNDKKISITFTANLPDGYAYFKPDLAFTNISSGPGSYEFRRFKIERGNKATDWCPNPEDKVNVSDMRKPASDVAGIDEVNTKQDKIGYTPADDSKVVHDNHDGTIKINGNSFTPALLDSAIGKNAHPIDTDVDTLAKPGLYYVSGSAPNNPFKSLIILENRVQYDWNAFRGVQIAYEVMNNSGIAVRSINPNGNFTSVGSSSPWALLSDDSKVAHLSGANNFDTVPTVKNNPLLLASSLPSDLARTGQANTFTDAQTFSIAPTITDASQDKGDTQAATMADLKSVENSAWRVLKEDKVVASGTCPPITSQKVLYQVDSNSNRLNLSVSFQLSDKGVDDQSLVTLDFSGVIKNITGFKDGMANGMGAGWRGMDAKYSGSKVIINMNQQRGCWPDNTFWLSYDQLAGN